MGEVGEVGEVGAVREEAPPLVLLLAKPLAHLDDVVGVVVADGVVADGVALLFGVGFDMTRRPSWVRWTFLFVGVVLLL